MDINHQFKEVEKTFFEIRKQFQRKMISRREFIDRLKKLRLRDDQGRFWMIGAQSGKWYYFDGKDWVQSDMPSEGGEGIVCPSCGHGNPVNAVECLKCGEPLEQAKMTCPECGRPIKDPLAGCPICSQSYAVPPPRIGDLQAEAVPPGRLVLKHVDPLSALLFLGGFGAVFGIILGAFTGASDYFSGFAKSLPSVFSELHGTITGGILFGFMGGVAGFILIAILGFLSALLFNIIASFVGGLKLTMESYEPQVRDVEEEDKSDENGIF